MAVSMDKGAADRRRPLGDRLFDALGNEADGGGCHPPMDRRTWYWGDPIKKDWGSMPGTYVASQTEDGSALYIGHVDEWYCHMTLRESRRLALWLLWNWVKDWGGLRTWIWYRMLHRRTRGYR